jgi:hypothetical protein
MVESSENTNIILFISHGKEDTEHVGEVNILGCLADRLGRDQQDILGRLAARLVRHEQDILGRLADRLVRH